MKRCDMVPNSLGALAFALNSTGWRSRCKSAVLSSKPIMSRPVRPREQPARKAGHIGLLTFFRVMSADDHVHLGSAYMHTDKLTDPEICLVDGSLHICSIPVPVFK